MRGCRYIGLCVAVVAALIGSGALAQSAKPAGVVGIGVGTCGVFGKKYAKNPEFYEISYFAWAQGLMSGINAGFKAGHMTNLKPTDFPAKEQMAFIRQYCAENPLRSYYDAVFELYIYLREKQGLH